MMRVIYDFQRVSFNELHFEQWLIDESVIVMLVPVFLSLRIFLDDVSGANVLIESLHGKQQPNGVTSATP